ncbi:MAG: hypothetical protein R2939_11505 [Kofleriaceae bacterium]
MLTIRRHRFGLALGLVTLLATAACGGLPGVPGVPGGSSGKVDPNTCGNYATSDTGRKLKAFLQATSDLNETVIETEKVVKQSCVMMGQELGMAAGQLEGDTKSVCTRVINTIDENMKVAIKADARLTVDYKPAVCTVNIDAAARAAAECEGKAQADVEVRCEGTCSGTCNGTCSGECHGSAGTGGSGGQCDGHCEGTCSGSCSGGCEGNADVQASAQCKASAEVKASVDVTCTEAELEITADAGVVIDPSKAEMTINALKRGLPKLLSVRARLQPLKAAVSVWAKTAKDLASEAREIAQSFKDQFQCISGQIAAAAGMVANINASISVSVEVSASASASGGVN